MKVLFYTIIIGWVIWKVLNAITSFTSKNKGAGNSTGYHNSKSPNTPAEGTTSIKFQPPKNQKISDNEGEYVDFEDVED